MFRGIGNGAPSPYGDLERQSSQRFDVQAAKLLTATPAERESTLKEVEAKNPGLANRLRHFLDRASDQQETFLKHLDSQSPAEKEKAVGWPSGGWNAWREELRDVQDRMGEMAKQQHETMKSWMDKHQTAIGSLTPHQKEAVETWTANQKTAIDQMVADHKAALDKWQETLKGVQVQLPTLPNQSHRMGLTGQPLNSIIFTPEDVPVMGTGPTAKGQVTAYSATTVMPDTPKATSPLHIVSSILGRRNLSMSAALDAYGRQGV